MTTCPNCGNRLREGENGQPHEVNTHQCRGHSDPMWNTRIDEQIEVQKRIIADLERQKSN